MAKAPQPKDRDPFQTDAAMKTYRCLQEKGFVSKGAQPSTKRTLGCIACHLRRGERVSATGLAECTDVSKSDMSKILYTLTDSGLLDGPWTGQHAGRGGHPRLMYEVSKAAAPLMRDVPCTPGCAIERGCAA